jgi:hypothetical protein
MVRVAISQAAFDAIGTTLPVGSTRYENAVNEKGGRLIWLERRMLDKLNSIAGLARAIAISSCGWRRKETRLENLALCGSRQVRAYVGDRQALLSMRRHGAERPI